MSDAFEWRLRTILANVLSNGMTPEAISTDADLVDEYGVDSLQTMAFLLSIEDVLDLQIDYENLRLDHLKSVRRLATFLISSSL